MNSINLDMLHSLKPFQCPGCTYAFSNRDVTRQHATSRFPLILPCAHTLCESCIRISVRTEKRIICAICQNSADLLEGETVINKLSPDLHALGVLSATLKQGLPSLKMKFVPAVTPKSLETNTATVLCENCNQTQASYRCDDCEQNFCNTCFDHIHSRVKSMKKHTSKKIAAEIYSTMVQEGCAEHKRPIEFFCEDDGQLACSYCVVMGEHKGHTVLTLLEKNKSCAGDLRRTLEEINVVYKGIKLSERKINEAIPEEKIDISYHMKDVHEHFHKLHALLQLRETKLVAELEEISNINTQPLEKMRQEVSCYQRDLFAIIRDAELTISNPCMSVSAPAILKKLEECKTLPYHLVPIDERTDWSTNIELEFDLSLDDLLLRHGKITPNVKPKYSLKSTNELSEDFLNEECNELSLREEYESTVCSKSDTFSEDSINQPANGYPASHKYKEFSSMHQERIIVSHIKSPGSFWTQKCADVRKLKAMADAINRWCRPQCGREKIADIRRGDLYLVQYSMDQNWYRGRILEVYEPEETYEASLTLSPSKRIGTVLKNNEQRVRVQYIDYGNSEIVPVSKLKNIQSRFLSSPNMAKECSLWHIIPISDNDDKEWSPEATKEFAKFVGKRPMMMQIIEEVNNVLFVDLCQGASDDIIDDTPVSIRDALVFLEHGYFPSGYLSKSRKDRNLRKLIPSEPLKSNVNISAIISHVDTPSLFYVQQMSTARYLSELIFDMQNTYSTDLNTMLNGIYAPYVGMICAAQFGVDKQWYRAEVLGLPGGATVHVRYVDFGNTEIIHYKVLRKLFDRFCKLNIQAIPCCLADVSWHENKWTEKSKQWLTQLGSKKQLVLKSFGVMPGENVTKVVVCDTDDEFEICINALMVEEGIAVSTGPLSKVLRKPREIPEKKESPIKPKITPEEEPKPEAKKVEIVKPKTSSKNNIEVYVSFIENPGLFHVRFKEFEEKLKQLMEELQKVYKGLEAKPSEITVGAIYAVFYEAEKQWYRGVIMAKLSEEKLKVRLLDYGIIAEVEPKHLQVLLENFFKDESFAIKCHLSGLIPAGGSNQWPHIATEAFQLLAEPHETLKLKLIGAVNKKGKSLPSDLIVEEMVRGGALEPTRFVTYSVSALLIERGVALPVRKQDDDSVKSKSSSNLDSSSETSSSNVSTPQRPTKPVVIQKPPPDPKFRWKPPVIPKDSTFMGMITNISDEGHIHLHLVQNGSSHVDLIKRALECKYETSSYEYPRIPPPIGEACMAKFSIDNLWYRAEILSTYAHNIDKVKVNFVDYGNNEIISLTDIRTDIIMLDFPRQCLNCKLHAIKPVGSEKWSSKLLDYLHENLVEQICTVEVQGPVGEDGCVPIVVCTPNGIDISQLLLNMNEAERIDAAAQSIVLKESADNDSDLPDVAKILDMKGFAKATKLPENEYFPVCITQFFEPNMVCIQSLKVPHPETDFEKERNEEYDNFLKLMKELSMEGDSFPPILEPVSGMACCSEYSYDSSWYRCEITALDEDSATVLYVDYGNSEVVPAENLRQVPDHFLSFPIQVHFCSLHGMKCAGKTWDPKVKEYFVQKFFSEDAELYAKVVAVKNVIEVELYIKNEKDDFILAYLELVEQGLIVLE